MSRATSDVRPAPTREELVYEGFPLESVLARVHEAHGAGATIVGAERVRRGGIGGFFAREVFQVTVVVPEHEGIDAEPGTVSADTAVDRADDDLTFVPLGRMSIFDDDRPVLLDDALDGDPGFDTDDIDPEDIPGALGLRPAPPARRDPSDAEIWDLLARAALAPNDLSVASSPTEVAEVVEPLRASGPIASTRLIPARSPHDACDAFDLPDLGELIASFEPHWRAPALPAAGVIAVVGARAEALGVAGSLAAAIGLPADDVIVATPSVDLVVPTADEAMRLAASTRFRCTPVAVIVVEVIPGRQGHEWARVVLDGLRPEQVRYAVDTAALVGQQHRTIAAIGGVDVIDLLGAAEHPDPTAALDATAPIGTIDGRAATPEMWAATVLAARVRHRAHRPLANAGSVVS